VFETGEPATELYLLISGEVTLVRPADDTYRLRPPALIGELGALTGLPRSCRAVVAGQAELFRLEAAAGCSATSPTTRSWASASSPTCSRWSPTRSTAISAASATCA
jgi:hypothetical protein